MKKVYTSEFKIEIGTIFQDDKRNLKIIDREYRPKEKINKLGRKSIVKLKYYKYYCYVCGWTEGWIEESTIMRGTGCSCCSGKTVIEGINDIPTTAPWMVKYFQGGYDEAKLYTKSSGEKIYPICPDCGRIKNKKMSICTINKYFLGCTCSDKIPYSEKIMFNILEQLGLDFQTQLSKTKFKWCNKYKYDFYFKINNEKYICEVNGIQHYDKAFETCGGDTIKEVQENDKLKKELALQNGIKEENYIVIDCRKSELYFIKQNILKSRLNELFDLSIIDWNKCQEFGCTNLVKIACEYKKNNPNITTTEIGKFMGYSSTTICKWLKKGNGIWCNYNPKEEHSKNIKKVIKLSCKPVEIIQNGILKGVFPSATELDKQSEKLFGEKLNFGNISAVCRKKKPQYKGYVFNFITYNEYIKQKQQLIHNDNLVQTI